MSKKAIGLILPQRITRAGRGGGGVTGAETAGMSTMEALIRHGSGPQALFAPAPALASLRTEIDRLVAPAPSPPLHPAVQLRDHLQAEALRALHTHSSDLHPQAAARSRYAASVVPLTCMQYSICQTSVHLGSFLHYFLSDLYPCDAVLCTTRCARQAQLNILSRMADALEPLMGKRPLALRHEVIPYPVDVEYFHPPSPQQRLFARQILGLPMNGRLALYVGRLEPSSKSDLRPLLLAFRTTLQRLEDPKDVHLALAGYGPDREIGALRAMAEEFGFADRLHIHTEYPPNQQALYYQAADLFVSLSDTLQENFGLTPVEAMACGLPVIVSDWAGYQETVEHGVTGFKVKTLWAPEDADLVGLTGFLPSTETLLPLSQGVLIDLADVADRLTTLLQRPELRLQMGEAARKRVEANYASSVVAAQMEALWEELAKEAAGLEKRPRAEVSLYETSYSMELQPYASQLLPPDPRLLLTEYGREVLGGTLTLPLTGSLESAYQQEALISLLGALKAGSLVNRGLPLGELTAQAAKKYGLTSSTASRHLTWLVKHGLANIKP
jgi:D-inositol-3-phosphate glycosyltransferase